MLGNRRPYQQFFYVYGFYGAYSCYGPMRYVQDSLLSVLVHWVHTVFWSAGFRGRGKPWHKTLEIAELR